VQCSFEPVRLLIAAIAVCNLQRQQRCKQH
jgi:hypothetical protein